MVVGIEDLATYCGASPADPTLADALRESEILVDGYLGVAGRQSCPDTVRDLAIKVLGSELHVRRSSPGGITQWAGPDGAAPVRLSRDPLNAIRPLLDRYRGLGTVG